MNSVETVKHELEQAVERMIALLDATPEDRLSWKPSEHARSILEIVAHSADALDNIRTQMEGTPFNLSTSAEADALFRARDRTFDGRPMVAQALHKACERYVAFLDSLTPEALERVVALPFGLGLAPVGAFLDAGVNHTRAHAAQIEYVQTIYADHDWHTGF